MCFQMFRLSIVRFSILNLPIEKTWKLKEAEEEETKQDHKSLMFPSSEFSEFTEITKKEWNLGFLMYN